MRPRERTVRHRPYQMQSEVRTVRHRPYQMRGPRGPSGRHTPVGTESLGPLLPHPAAQGADTGVPFQTLSKSIPRAMEGAGKFGV